jgi:Trk K+ transport system NAD-binding subunit
VTELNDTLDNNKEKEPGTTADGDFNIRNHIIICNWTSKADVIVRQLHDESVHERNPIIAITDRPEQVPKSADKAYRGLLIIGGDPADKEILKRADIKYARTAVILADEEDMENADSKSILIQLAIDSINPNVHTIVELVKSSSEMYFQYTHVNEIICLEQLAEKLLSQAALTPGLSEVYMNLLTQSADTNEMYLEEVPEPFIGKTYEDVEREIVSIEDKDIILIGWTTKVEKIEDGKAIVNGRGNIIFENEVIINPKSSTKEKNSKSHIFKRGDLLFLIAYKKPNLAKYFDTDSPSEEMGE